MNLDTADAHALPGRTSLFGRIGAAIDAATAPTSFASANLPPVLESVIIADDRHVQRDGLLVARLDGVPISYNGYLDSVIVGRSVGPMRARRCCTTREVGETLEQHQPASLRYWAAEMESATSRSMMRKMMTRIVKQMAAVAVLLLWVRFATTRYDAVAKFAGTASLRGDDLELIFAFVAFGVGALTVVVAFSAAVFQMLGAVAAPLIAASNYSHRFAYAAQVRRYADDVEANAGNTSTRAL